MKVTVAIASSVDGKLTRGDDPDIRSWTSPEDAAHFARLKADHNLIVMGRKTYTAMRAKLKPHPRTLRLVLTRHPEKFAAETVKGQLEFSSDTPLKLVRSLEEQGYTEMLLIGGGQVNSAFLAAGLVHEIYLTVEPWLFGTGIDATSGLPLSVTLKLISMRKLNARGTLLLHYKLEPSTP